MIVVTVVEVTITLTVLVGGRLCGGDKTRLIRYDFKENQTTDNAPTTTLCLSALLQMYQKTFNFQLSTFLWMGGGSVSDSKDFLHWPQKCIKDFKRSKLSPSPSPQHCKQQMLNVVKLRKVIFLIPSLSSHTNP